MDTAKIFRENLSLPLIYVGGMISKDKMDEVLDNGFVAFQMARSLINDTNFVNKLMSGEVQKSGCGHSNYCIGRMYSKDMKCHYCVENLPHRLQKEIDSVK